MWTCLNKIHLIVSAFPIWIQLQQRFFRSISRVFFQDMDRKEKSSHQLRKDGHGKQSTGLAQFGWHQVSKISMPCSGVGNDYSTKDGHGKHQEGDTRVEESWQKHVEAEKGFQAKSQESDAVRDSINCIWLVVWNIFIFPYIEIILIIIIPID